MAAPDTGFALVRKGLLLHQAFEASPVAVRFAQELRLMRIALNSVVPGKYAGIGRYPLNADYPYVPPGWQWAQAKRDEIDDSTAMVLLRSALGLVEGEFPQEEWLIDGPWLIQGLDVAREIRRISQYSAQLEIIEVARFPNRTTAPSLGFDVGYWASGNFSLICDSAIWPLWHAPDMADVETLAEALKALNERMLFDAPDEARRFREFYRSCGWAEIEAGTPFELIEIAIPGSE